MENRTIKLSKPLYEAMPYLYLAMGGLGIVGAWLLAGKFWSDLSLVLGITALIGGAVVLLRRREYRVTKSRYSGGPLDPT